MEAGWKVRMLAALAPGGAVGCIVGLLPAPPCPPPCHDALSCFIIFGINLVRSLCGAPLCPN